MKIVTGLYDDRYRAKAAIEGLLDEGFTSDELSVITRHGTPEDVKEELEHAQQEEAAKGAGAGAFLGSIAGLQATLVAMAVPGIGPILAGGAAATALLGTGAGAVAGGLIGGLVGAGLPEEEAEQHAQAVRRGCTLVAVHVDEPRAPRATAVIDRHKPVHVGARDETEASDMKNRTGVDEGSAATNISDELTRGRKI